MISTKETNVKINFFYQVFYQILILALPLIMSPYVSRVLGAEGLGIYSYSYSIAYYFVLASMLGILNYGNRTISQCRDNQDELNEKFSSIVTLHIFISLLCVVLYLLYIFFVAKEKLYAFMQLAYVFSGLFDISWFYYGIEKFKLTIARNTVIKVITVLLVFAFVKDPDDLGIYCLIMSCSMFISQIILWIPIKKYVTYIFPAKEEISSHLKPMLILFIPTIAISLYKYMDKIMIGLLSNKVQLGFYENAESIIRVLTSIIGSLGTVMLPQMSNLAANNNMEQFYKNIGLSMRYVMIMAFAMSFGVAGIAGVFAPFFWGNSFAASGKLIQILTITVPFMAFANVIRTQFLLPREKDVEYMISVISGALVNLIINIILIPKYGAVGASVATVFAEGMVCIIQAVAVRKDLPLDLYVKDTIPFGILGIIMLGIVYYIKYLIFNAFICLLIQVLVGITLYSLFSYVILCKKKDILVADLKQKIGITKNEKNSK